MVGVPGAGVTEKLPRCLKTVLFLILEKMMTVETATGKIANRSMYQERPIIWAVSLLAVELLFIHSLFH